MYAHHDPMTNPNLSNSLELTKDMDRYSQLDPVQAWPQIGVHLISEAMLDAGYCKHGHLRPHSDLVSTLFKGPVEMQQLAVYVLPGIVTPESFRS